MMLLSDLMESQAIKVLAGDAAASVEGIAYDSRQVKSGDVFVALASKSNNGHGYIQDAYSRGARVFVVEHWPDLDLGEVTVIAVPDTRLALALMSQRFFDFPDRKLTVVALTGTKGKTTISFMVKAICEAAGKRVGLIGSNGVFYGETYFKLPNTTPESFELNRIMADMVEAGVEILVVEATSQGFMMRRTDGIRFDIGVYTNIAPDHISATEHDSFEEYFNCKKRIFAQSEVCLVDFDTFFTQIMEDVSCPILTYGFSTEADYQATNVHPSQDDSVLGTHFVCRTPQFTQEFCIHIPGHFNVSNAMAAIGIAVQLGLDPGSIASGLLATRVPGRVELVDVPAPYTVLIDFAHNGLSLEALIDAVKAYHPRRVLSVFGLEGNRAHIRRTDCGKILGAEVDYTILADASPRFDDPDQILTDIASGIEQGGGQGRYEIIRDRRTAIPALLSMAEEGDVVLLIGKGSVLYEEVQGVNHPIDERDIVKEYFARA
ncbi:MAG: UDP-N-acetylmuramoyl-L-alanyl-D-glutamate--2,6-diaminopimelate ligase [Propionibacteriaceae bacterium]|nr:UDP-N-acetylmuramoyl-L-alanyl-D-glutamate--2,6-diaminopimelate ligase [Propionibacteriaceae bacterium]